MNSLYELLNKEIISLGLDNYSNLDFYQIELHAQNS